VFCGYRDRDHELDDLLGPIERQQPTLVVTTPDGTTHTLWRESHPGVVAAVRGLFAQKQLHVLDGHARYEGMLAHSDSLVDLSERSTARFGLACVVNLDDPALMLAPRHRVIRGPKSRAEVLTAAKPYFKFERIPGAAYAFDKQRAALADLGDALGFLALFPDDPDAWLLTLLPEVKLEAAQKIDAVVFEQVFKAHVAPGAQTRSVLEATTVSKAVDDGAIGLILRPLSLAHLLYADESGALLPFGSTAVAPALARLVTYVIQPREEL
jgi:uncharacterized protein (DUF1015 family)